MNCPETTAGRSFRKQTLEEAQKWLEKRLHEEALSGTSMCAVEDCSGKMIGLCGLFPREDIVELGYVVKHEFQRKGLGREAIAAIVKQAHTAGFEVFATIRPCNSASLKIAEAVGLIRSVSRLESAPDLDLYCSPSMANR